MTSDKVPTPSEKQGGDVEILGVKEMDAVEVDAVFGFQGEGHIHYTSMGWCVARGLGLGLGSVLTTTQGASRYHPPQDPGRPRRARHAVDAADGRRGAGHHQ